ncbi:MAG: hypothetical protein CMB80_11695 [Flammeovirgaceae bacterium]|nr:hypothetical protein [Flammeovirgaceae bacterium]MBE61510.1 hypothetical protein [Flammeovirgaceae bacterium]
MKNRFYKISVNIGPLRITNNSKVYKIEDGKSTIIPGIKYSLVCILFGWWGFRFYRAITDTLEALDTNFSGGEDVTQLISSQDYDEDTNYVWNNLLRQTTRNITKDELEIVLAIQNEYLENHPTNIYTTANTSFILFALKKLNIEHFTNEVIEDIYDALKMYSSK